MKKRKPNLIRYNDQDRLILKMLASRASGKPSPKIDEVKSEPEPKCPESKPVIKTRRSKKLEEKKDKLTSKRGPNRALVYWTPKEE